MNDKSKDELIIELQQENNSLKELIDKELNKSRQIEETAVLFNDGLSKVNQFSIELSMLSPKEDLKALIVKRIKEFSGARLAMFSDYNHASHTLTTEHFEMEPGLLEKFISLVSKKGQVIRSAVSDEMYQYLIKEIAEVRKSFYDVNFGSIPRPVASAMQALFKVDRFIGISYLVEGELYGTSLLGMARDTPDPQMQILKSLISLASVSLRRKLAEERIREKDIQFRKLSANVSDLIFQLTRKYDGTYFVPIASEGIVNIFGCFPEDVLDDFAPISRVIYPDDLARVSCDIEYSAEHLVDFTCEFRVQIPGKAIQWIFSRASPEKLPDGSITWYGFNSDITDRKKAEQELITAKEHAEQSDRLKSAFLANMSHEIRTPMNGILGFADLLKEPELTGEQQQEYIGIIEESGIRMLNIINNIVDISKIEARLTKLDLMESNVNEKIEYIYTFFKPEVEAKGLTLSYKNALPKDKAIIKTDRDKFFAILTNLVKNAIKYTSKGSIEFGYNLVTFDHTPSLQFFVKDTGIGIPKDRHEAIFERFIQADIFDKMATQGAGLGLSITKSYIEMLGGKIWVESKEGEGSTFYFTLPC